MVTFVDIWNTTYGHFLWIYGVWSVHVSVPSLLDVLINIEEGSSRFKSSRMFKIVQEGPRRF